MKRMHNEMHDIDAWQKRQIEATALEPERRSAASARFSNSFA